MDTCHCHLPLPSATAICHCRTTFRRWTRRTRCGCWAAGLLGLRAWLSCGTMSLGVLGHCRLWPCSPVHLPPARRLIAACVCRPLLLSADQVPDGRGGGQGGEHSGAGALGWGVVHLRAPLATATAAAHHRCSLAVGSAAFAASHHLRLTQGGPRALMSGTCATAVTLPCLVFPSHPV